MKKCPKCKETKPLFDFYNNKKLKDGKQCYCKPCFNSSMSKSYRKYQQQNWNGVANVIRGHMKASSLKKGLEWRDDWWTKDKILERIKDKSCEVTGIKFDLSEPKQRGHRRPFVPSPDRIDNTRGYEPDNVQWVVWIYNLMENTFDEDQVGMFIANLKDTH